MKMREAEVAEGQTDKAAGTVVEVAKRRILCTDRRRTEDSLHCIPGKREWMQQHF